MHERITNRIRRYTLDFSEIFELSPCWPSQFALTQLDSHIHLARAKANDSPMQVQPLIQFEAIPMLVYRRTDSCASLAVHLRAH